MEHARDERTRGFKKSAAEAAEAEMAKAREAAGPVVYLDDQEGFEDEDFEDAGALDEAGRGPGWWSLWCRENTLQRDEGMPAAAARVRCPGLASRR